jgi:chromosome partitioning protein
VGKLLETVQLVSRRMNPQLKVSGIALTMFDSNTRLSNEVVDELNSFVVEGRGRNLPWSNAIIFDTRIRRNVKLAESPSFGQTIMRYGPKSAGANDYRALAKEVIAMEPPAAAPAATSGAEPQRVEASRVEVSVNPNLDASKLAGAKKSDDEVAA